MDNLKKDLNFALIGASGYVAPRHMQAIKDNDGNLLAAVDPNDSVGVIDKYFPQAAFFTEFERFDRHLEKLKRQKQKIDYLSDAHIRFGLRAGTNVICEKPIVLNPWNVEYLEDIEKETGNKIYNILQLRLHESVSDLRRKVQAGPKDKIYDIDLTYLTSRGNWYYASWKGNMEKSGGIATNIGVHFFDMLIWIFGDVKESTTHLHTHDRAAGILHLEKARVRWFLSINYNTLPNEYKNRGLRTYRALSFDGEEIEFSKGFENLHSASYAKILNGQGYRISEAKRAVETAYKIRHQEPIGLRGDYHPFANMELDKHPFKRNYN